MGTKIELKKELRKLGIQIIKGNYIKKSEALKVVKSKKNSTAKMADKFRAKTKTKKPPSDAAKLEYIKNEKFPLKEGPTEWATKTEKVEDHDIIL